MAACGMSSWKVVLGGILGVLWSFVVAGCSGGCGDL